MQISSILWRNAPAWLVQGDQLEAVITVTGANLACLRQRGDEVNPLWQPPWPWADPATVVGRPDGPYGDWPEAPLLANIVGSNLCLDRFGPPWPGERRPLHGEAGVVPWRVVMHGGTAEFTTDLPEARLKVRRRVTLAGDALVLATAACHDHDAPRAVEWCEHTTLGDPFLEGVEITAGVDRVLESTGEGLPLRDHDPAQALRVPGVDDPPAGSVLAARVTEPWWQADNLKLGRRLRAVWNRDDFPWLTLWTQHRHRSHAPWKLLGRTRGMEMSTKPFPNNRPAPGRSRYLLDRPVECLIPAGAWREHVIRFTWTTI